MGYILVGGLEHLLFSIDCYTSQLTFIFFRGVETTNQPYMEHMGYISITVAVRFSHFRKPHRGHVERCVDIAGPRGDCASELNWAW